MAEIPAGPAVLGEASEATDALRAGPLEVGAFAIDRVPVTEREFAMFLAETGRTEAAAQEWEAAVDRALVARRGRRRGDPAAAYRAHPAVLVSWDDAAAYCRWRGARLPSELEWEKAARGPEGRVFPWGDRADATRVNGLEAAVGDTVPVLTNPRAASPYGVHDVAGNAAEWTATPGPTPEHFIIRGSSFLDPAERARPSRRRERPRDARSVTLTFRCAVTP